MRTSISGTGGRLIVAALGGQVVFTITDGQTTRSIAVAPHVADLIASETLRTATYAERMGAMQREADQALQCEQSRAAQQAHSNVIGFPVGAPT